MGTMLHYIFSYLHSEENLKKWPKRGGDAGDRGILRPDGLDTS